MPPMPAVRVIVPASVPPNLLRRDGTEGLERALQNALGADVDPGSRRHLAVHHQAFGFQLAELLPVGPVTDEVRIRQEHTRRPDVRAEDADGLSGLHQHCLVVLERLQCANDRVERFPAARGPSGAAVDDEVVGMLGDLGVEIVHQHAKGCFLLPTLARDFGSARSTDGTRTGGRCHERLSPLTRLSIVR